MTPRKRWALFAVLPMVLLAGCQLRTEVGVAVDGDGGGELAFSLAADEQLRRAARRVGADPLATLAETGEGLEGWEVARTSDGGVEGVTLATSFSDPDELTRVSTQFADALAAPELRPLGPLRLHVGDETVQLRGTAALRVGSAVRELGVRRARARQVLADNVVLRVVARMPGEVLETNADTRGDDNTVSWTVAAGQRRPLLVVARRPWSVLRVARRVVLPLAIVALAIVALVFGWRRARTSSAASRSGDE